MRIIGGEFKGRKLYPIQGAEIRPTADRIRESIFNIIASRVPGAVVLDLFAGTGALGLEALSRGAEFIVFVDNYKKALNDITRNVQALTLDKKVKIINWDIAKNLDCINTASAKYHFQDLSGRNGWMFNLVFMDPPYNRGFINMTLHHLHLSGSIENDALIVIEHAPSEPIPENVTMFNAVDQRTYGNTLISLLNYVV